MDIKNLESLKINKMSKAQYERELAAGRIDDTQIYLTPAKVIESNDGDGNVTILIGG